MSKYFCFPSINDFSSNRATQHVHACGFSRIFRRQVSINEGAMRGTCRRLRQRSLESCVSISVPFLRSLKLPRVPRRQFCANERAIRPFPRRMIIADRERRWRSDFHLFSHTASCQTRSTLFA